MYAKTSEPIVFDDCYALLRPITATECKRYSRDVRNSRSCSLCPCPVRVCLACIATKFDFSKQVAERVDPKTGLCPFHKKHGKDVKRPDPEVVQAKIAKDPAKDGVLYSVVGVTPTTTSIAQKKQERRERPVKARADYEISNEEREIIQAQIDLLDPNGEEYRFLRLISRGYTNPQIKRELKLTEQRVIDTLGMLCEKIKLPKKSFSKTKEIGNYRRSVIKSMFGR